MDNNIFFYLGNTPFFTGLRVLDGIFPLSHGETCSIIGSFGSGRNSIIHSISKNSNSDVFIYVCCGERGNDLVEVLYDFPEITLNIKDKHYSIMNKTCMVGNSSNMSIAAREASIYTGITIAEYFRDMGYNVSMVADSTTRWAEALRELSGHMNEMPSEGGYPAYLTSRLAQFFERAGRVKCIGSPDREGSISLFGTVSPYGWDFTDVVTRATLSLTNAFWGLDRKLAQRKHFPCVNWTVSNCNEGNWKNFNNEFSEFNDFRVKIKNILYIEAELSETIQLIGKKSLTDEQKLAIEVMKKTSLSEFY